MGLELSCAGPHFDFLTKITNRSPFRAPLSFSSLLKCSYLISGLTLAAENGMFPQPLRLISASDSWVEGKKKAAKGRRHTVTL